MPTFLLCNPNAMFYQHMVNHPHAFYLRFFLNRGINVLIWNYRGYGLSHGSPGPFNIRTDADLLLEHMRDSMGLTGKIGVYGRSLGGIPTAHLAHKVDMVIVDRTFSDFDKLAQRKFYHKVSEKLFKVGTCAWKASNFKNYIDSVNDNSYKVMMIERNDEIVEFHSSLLVGVAREAHERLGGKSFEGLDAFIKSVRFITNLEHDLFTIVDYQSNKQNLQTEENNELSSSGFLYCCGGSSKYTSNPTRANNSSKVQP